MFCVEMKRSNVFGNIVCIERLCAMKDCVYQWRSRVSQNKL